LRLGPVGPALDEAALGDAPVKGRFDAPASLAARRVAALGVSPFVA
jgi:hypothetical protein